MIKKLILIVLVIAVAALPFIAKAFWGFHPKGDMFDIVIEFFPLYLIAGLVILFWDAIKEWPKAIMGRIFQTPLFAFRRMVVIARRKKAEKKDGEQADEAPEIEPAPVFVSFSKSAQTLNEKGSPFGEDKGIRLSTVVNSFFLPKKEAVGLEPAIARMVENVSAVVIAREFGKRKPAHVFVALEGINKEVKKALMNEKLIKDSIDEDKLFIGIIPDLGRKFNRINRLGAIAITDEQFEKFKTVIQAEATSKEMKLIEEAYKKIKDELMGPDTKIDDKKKANVFSILLGQARIDSGKKVHVNERLSPEKKFFYALGSVLALLGILFFLFGKPTSARNDVKPALVEVIPQQVSPPIEENVPQPIIVRPETGSNASPPAPVDDSEPYAFIDTVIAPPITDGIWQTKVCKEGYAFDRLSASGDFFYGTKDAQAIRVAPSMAKDHPYLDLTKTREFYVISTDDKPRTIVYGYYPYIERGKKHRMK